MKKYTSYIIACLTAVVCLSACSGEFDKINTNPNKMEVGAVHPSSLLPNILFSGASGMVSQSYNLADELIQYSVSSNTTDAYHRYQIPNGVSATLWNLCARWAASADHMRSLCGDDAALCNFKAIALTMRAYYMQVLTDSFGDAPFDEAFKGMEGLMKPVFNTQKEIYQALIESLLEANSLYNATYTMTDSQKAKDLLYGGDLVKWQKFTNSLLVRVLNRISGVNDPDIDAVGLLKEIQSNPGAYPVFASNQDSAQYRFTGVDSNLSPYGSTNEVAFNNSRRAGEFIVGLMDATGDPRISLYFVQVGGKWGGAVSGAPTRDETGASSAAMLNKVILGDYDSPFSFMNYDEVLFIWAEAAQKGIIPGGESAAENYYNQAVEASLRHWSEMPGNRYPLSELAISQFLSKIQYEGTYRQLMNQKYIALFWCGFEAWAEYRRTGYPELSIAPTTLNDNILPRRLEYPVNTAATNPENYAAAVARLRGEYKGDDDMKTPVWWSKYRVEHNL